MHPESVQDGLVVNLANLDCQFAMLGKRESQLKVASIYQIGLWAGRWEHFLDC